MPIDTVIGGQSSKSPRGIGGLTGFPVSRCISFEKQFGNRSKEGIYVN